MASQKLHDDVAWACRHLVDYSPLVAVMALVADAIRERGGSFDKPKARGAWLELMESLQGEWSFSEHNPRLPCRFCDRAFRPRLDDALLTAFLAWYDTRDVPALVALHRCPACGGRIAALNTQIYKGDFHTPVPGGGESDDDWTEKLLEHCDV